MKELTEILGFTVSLLEALGKSLDDGKIDFTDVTKLWEPISLAGEAIDGASKVLDEIRTMDEAKKAELMAYVQREFDIPQDEIEQKIEGGISVALGIAMYVSTFVGKKIDQTLP